VRRGAEHLVDDLRPSENLEGPRLHRCGASLTMRRAAALDDRDAPRCAPSSTAANRPDGPADNQRLDRSCAHAGSISSRTGRPPGPAPRRSTPTSIWMAPRAVLREFGLELGAEVEVRVWDSSAEIRYLVLPMRPPETDGWSEQELAALVTRDCMNGTAVPIRRQEAIA
jgi:Nitrile hydratase, alpha chain